MFRSNDHILFIAVSILAFIFAMNTKPVSGQESSLAKPGTVPGQRRTFNLDGFELAFRWCPAGTFMMGSPATELVRMPDPWEFQHQVTLTAGFWMLETEVTQKLFQLVVGKNPSYWKGDDRPVEMIGMPACVRFCDTFAKKTGLKAQLPTESQWEYACRAGSTSAFSSGDSMTFVDMQCRKPGASPQKQTQGTVPVRSFKPNAWGLYDMHGNVAEWVADAFDPEYYWTSPANDPPGLAQGADRVLRGGGWSSLPDHCRCASRSLDVEPYSLASSYGFRFMIVPDIKR
ncbi:MAG: formylglycine-generating enzyme family protein [Thermoguttaceae bacterium]|nr:formylglycine-generating enzyme family protein [Thermoguttaceae bacterium]